MGNVHAFLMRRAALGRPSLFFRSCLDVGSKITEEAPILSCADSHLCRSRSFNALAVCADESAGFASMALWSRSWISSAASAGLWSCRSTDRL
eukprot:scaffold53_cov193-Pinguiococcus_pyrenoidosus.AAC.34